MIITCFISSKIISNSCCSLLPYILNASSQQNLNFLVVSFILFIINPYFHDHSFYGIGFMLATITFLMSVASRVLCTHYHLYRLSLLSFHVVNNCVYLPYSARYINPQERCQQQIIVLFAKRVSRGFLPTLLRVRHVHLITCWHMMTRKHHH
jgi:hypothetical protein